MVGVYEARMLLLWLFYVFCSLDGYILTYMLSVLRGLHA